MRLVHAIGLAVLVVGLAGCAGLPLQHAINVPDAALPEAEAQSLAAADCLPRDDDPNGYLLTICQYIVENEVNVAPADPTLFHISATELGEYEGREVLIITLDCCGMGDVAYIDTETRTVVYYALGDY